jgi:hypothetical protein
MARPRTQTGKCRHCSRPASRRGLCDTHYRAERRISVLLTPGAVKYRGPLVSDLRGPLEFMGHVLT